MQIGITIILLYFLIFDLSQIIERFHDYFVDFEYWYIKGRFGGMPFSLLPLKEDEFPSLAILAHGAKRSLGSGDGTKKDRR